MFNAVKEYLDKGAEKWDADTERFIRQKLENACVSKRFGKDAEELRSLQEMLYVLYTTLSNSDMAKRVKKVGFDRLIRKCFDEALSKDHQERKEWEVIEEQLLDVVNAIAEGLTDDKDSFLLEFCPKCLDLVLKRQTNYLHGIEVLKGCNMILENCTLTTKEKILQRTDNANKLKAIAAKLETLGDYECQVGILECLFRIIPRKQRREYATNFFHSQTILDRFMLIKDAQFETDCRIFLNEYNASIPNQLVYSIPCTCAVLGNKELVKPNDEEYEQFWVDFNTGTKRITLFCEQSSNSENDCDFWETISIRNEDVAEIKLQKTKITTDLEIMFEKPIRILFPSQTSVDGQHMQIHFASDTDIELVVEQTLPDCCNVIQSSQKVSTVEFPVKIQRDFSQEVTEPKATEKNTHKASSPCTPMHLVQDNWRRERKDSGPLGIDTEQEEQKKRPVKQAAVRVSSKKGYSSSVSSKASHTASPLKISSATFYSNVQSKRERKVTTPKIPAVGKKKKVKTPVVTVTPPVKKFKTNIEAGKRGSTKTLNDREKKTETKQQRLQSTSTNSSKEKKVTIGKSTSTNVHEDKNDMSDLDIEEEILLSEMEDAVQDLRILDKKEEDWEKIDRPQTENSKNINYTETGQSKLKHSSEQEKDTALDIIGSKYSNADNHISSKKEIVFKKDIFKNPPSKKLCNTDTECDKIKATVSPVNDCKREVKQSANSDEGVEENMIQPTEVDSVDSDADDCLMTNVCVYAESDINSTRDSNSQQETENQQCAVGKRSRKCVQQNVPNNSGINESEEKDKKLQGRKRGPTKTSTKKQVSPVVELQRLETIESCPVNSTVPTKGEAPMGKKSVQPSKKRGRPKGSKKKETKALPASSKTQKSTTGKGLYALTDKTKQCSDNLPMTDTAVFEWKDEDEEESNSKVTQTISKSAPLVDVVDSDQENEIDVIQESQENARNSNDCASNKSLATDLSFKESPWYKCMPQHSKYNTKWFKTYGKVRGSQRVQTASNKDVDFCGDSPAVKKYSQQVTKTLSVQMTYSSQCVSSPGGDAGNDPYIFDDNCSEYSNNLMLNSKKTKPKQINQKSVKRGKGRGRKKTDSPDYVYKDVYTSRQNKSNKYYDERQKASKKEDSLYDYDAMKQSRITKYNHTDEENTVSLYQMENTCQMERQQSKPKPKNSDASKTSQRRSNRQKESDEDDYAISCIPSPEEAFYDGSLSGFPLESQNITGSCMDNWKPTKGYSFMEEKNEVQKYAVDTGEMPSPSESPVPRKKQKRSIRSKMIQNLENSPANTAQPTTPESILSKFRRSCQKLVEESCCSEENVASRLQTPLVAVSPYVERTEQDEIENEIDCSQTSEKSQSQESIESEPRCLKRKHKISLSQISQDLAKENSCLAEEDIVVDKGLQMNWLQRIQAAHKYKTSDDDKENMSISISTASSQEVESVVSEKISSFGAEIQNHMQAKKKQLDCMTKDVLRSLMKICSKSSRETREQRTKYIEKFQHIVLEELKAIEKDVSSLKKTEDECMLYFEKKLQEIQRHTSSQEKSIHNLMAAKDVFMEEMHHCEQYTDKSQLKAQYSIKKELEVMKTRLVSKNQQDELENIKRCLQQSFSVG